MEICNLAVDPVARKMGVAGELVEALMQASRSKDLSGLFSRPTMEHEASQKLLNKSGFTPCGMYFNMIPPGSAADLSQNTHYTH